jgi:hypothetical protein
MGKAAAVEYDAITLKAAKALRVQPEDILGSRQDEDDAIFAVVNDGRKVRIEGRVVEILTGPGYVDPDADGDDLTVEELLAELAAERKASRRR